MPQKPLPVVSDHLLHVPDMEANEHTPVVVGTERWYSWLAEEQNRSFSFRNALGTFTVRRERKRHGWYWYIYRKSGGKLRKAYLGKAEELTLERLGLVAATLVDQPEDGDDSRTMACAELANRHSSDTRTLSAAVSRPHQLLLSHLRPTLNCST